MKNTSIAALALALLCGCGTRRDTSAILARVQLASDLPATCVLLQVRGADGEVLTETKVVREPGTDELRVAIYRGNLPEEVALHARPMYGNGCADPLRPNGTVAEERARFPAADVNRVLLALERPSRGQDEDGDGFAGGGAGGPDCADRNQEIRPGVAEQCMAGVDMDCNGLAGCRDPACAGKACVAPPSQLAFVTPPQRVQVDTCSGAVALEARDERGVARNVAAETPITLLAAPSTNFNFYADAGCRTAITATAIPRGANTVSFYYRGTTAGPVTLTASSSGIASVSQLHTLVAGQPVALAIASAPRSAVADTCSEPVLLQARDVHGNAAPRTTATLLSLSAAPPDGFTFYSDATCATPVTSITLPAGQGTVGVHFRGARKGTVKVTATDSSGGLTPVGQDQSILAGPPKALVFTTPTLTVPAGNCSSLLTVESQDGSGNASPVAANTRVDLTGSANLSFYTDANCTTLVTSITIAAGASSAGFHFRSTQSGPVTVTASGGGLTQITQGHTITPAAPSALAITSASQTVTAGGCSPAVNLQVRDGFGSPSNVSAPTPVNLAATPATNFTFYSDAACATPVTSVTVAAGSSTARFYFRGTRAGPVTVTVSASGLTEASQVETIRPATAVALAFASLEQTLAAGACSAQATVQWRDTYGNVAPVSADRTVSLSASPGGGFAFYSDAGCTTPITSVTVPTNSSTATFWFRGTVANTVTLTATSGSVNTTQSAIIRPAAPGAIAIATGAQTVTAGSCSSALTVQLRDAFGNTTSTGATTAVALSASSPGLVFYSDPGCGNPVTSITIAANTSSADAYFRSTQAGAVTVTVSASGLGSPTQTETIRAASASTIVFASGGQTVTAGACSAAVGLQVQDTYGNPTTVTSATTVTLGASPTSGFTFYSNSSCTTTIPSLSISSGSGTGTFWFRGTQAGPVTVTATTASLGSPTQGETILPAAPSAMAFSTPPRTVTAGGCSTAATLQLKDTYGNSTTATSALPVSLAANPVNGFTFYSDSGCTTPVTGITIQAGSGTGSFHFSDTSVGSTSVTASSTLGSVSQSQSTIAASPNKLVITSASQAVTAGSCSGVVAIQARDVHGNDAVFASPTTLSFSATSGAGVVFYSDAGCTAAIAQVTVPAGSGSTGVYFIGTKAGPMDITVSATGVTSATQPGTINPAQASAFAFTSTPQTVTVGTCSGAVTIRTEDAYGNPVNVGAKTTVDLSASPGTGFSFYAGSTCTGGTITSVSINAGSGTATFYFRGNTAGSVTITVSANGFTSASQSETLAAGAATNIAFATAPQTVAAGACSGATRVEARDALGNASAVLTSTTVSLTAAPNGNFGFYADVGCNTPTSAVTLTAGSSSATFYFRGTTATTVTVTASTTSLGSATQGETITGASPAALVLVPASGQTLPAGQCSSALTAQVKDAFGNDTTVASATPVTLSASPSESFAFYSDATCTTGITGTTIPANGGNATFYYRGTKAGSVTITASSGLGNPTRQETITPATANTLAFATAAQTLTAGQCSFPVRVETRDTHGNVSNVGPATTVSLTASPSNGFTFYADPGCTQILAPQSVTIPANGNSQTFYFSSTSANPSVQLTASATGFSAAVQQATIRAGTPTALFFVTAPQTTVPAGACSGVVTVESRDIHGNPTTTALSVGLTANPSTDFGFYSDPACTASITDVSIPGGASTGSFYFRGITGGNVDITASANGLTFATQTETIVGMVRTGTCTLLAGNNSVSCTISPALTDTSKAFLVFQATNEHTAASVSNLMCYILNPTTVSCSRSSTQNFAVDIRWYIPQFNSGVLVQHFQPTCTGSTTKVTLGTPVDPNSTFLLLSSKQGTNSQTGTTRSAVLTNSTNVDILRDGGCAGGEQSALQVVQFTGATVQRGKISNYSGTTRSVGSLPATTGGTFLLYSYWTSASGNTICDRALRGEVTNPTTISFSRGDGTNCGGQTLEEVSWERVELPSAHVVQQVNLPMSSGQATASLTIASVDPTRSIVFSGGQWASGQVHGEGSYSASSIIGEMRARQELTGPNTIQLTRDSTNGTAEFTSFVIQFQP